MVSQGCHAKKLSQDRYKVSTLSPLVDSGWLHPGQASCVRQARAIGVDTNIVKYRFLGILTVGLFEFGGNIVTLYFSTPRT